MISDGLNYYMIGSYGGTLNLPLGTLQSNGNNDIFIIKFDFNGNQLWAKTLGGNYTQPDVHEDAGGVYDPVNNCIYIGGTFINSINFGNGVTLSSSHYDKQEIFVARMDLNGNFIWAKQGGSFGYDNGTFLFVEPDGDVLLAGKIGSAGNIDTVNIPARGFFARFDSNGNLKWAAHKFSGPDNLKISVSFIGSDIVMAGLYSQNPSYIDTATLVPSGSTAGYITRMDSVGKVKWIKKINCNILGISIDSMHNIYATGYFKDTINIDGFIMIDTVCDLFLAKFNKDGNLIWARQAFANNFIMGQSIKTNANGDSYITGLFVGSASFGSYNVSTSNTSDMFLTRYNNNGVCLGITHFGWASSLCLMQDISSNVVCGGVFFNTVNIGDSVFTSYGQQDIFISKSNAITGIVGPLKSTTNNQLIIYANPTTGKCSITVPDEFLNETNLILSIFDNSGKIIQQKKLEMSENKIKLDLEAEAKGVYTAVLSNGRKSYSGKIVFE